MASSTSTSTTPTVPQGIDMPIVRGDNDTYSVEIYTPDTVDPTVKVYEDLSVALDGTADRPAIVQFMVKRKPKTELDPAAIILKTTYDDQEMKILDQTVEATKGRVTLYIDQPDTEGEEIACYTYEVQVSQQDFIRTSAGTASNSAGDTAVVGSGTSFLDAKKGDILHWTSGPNLGQASIIKSITDGTNLVTEKVWDNASSGDTFEIRRARTRTRLQGNFFILLEVNRG